MRCSASMVIFCASVLTSSTCRTAGAKDPGKKKKRGHRGDVFYLGTMSWSPTSRGPSEAPRSARRVPRLRDRRGERPASSTSSASTRRGLTAATAIADRVERRSLLPTVRGRRARIGGVGGGLVSWRWRWPALDCLACGKGVPKAPDREKKRLFCARKPRASRRRASASTQTWASRPRGTSTPWSSPSARVTRPSRGTARSASRSRAVRESRTAPRRKKKFDYPCFHAASGRWLF